ncbi:TPA: antiviral reverse transcriptase Drt3a [Providencia alcalifaciens]
MLNQAITVKNLLRLIRKSEPKKFRMGRERDDYVNYINNGLKLINPTKHEFQSIKKGRINGKNIVFLTDLIEILTLRKCNDNIKRIFNLKKSDRQDTIKKTHIMLSEAIPYFVYRLDIKSFYENIDKYKILEKIKDSSIVSYPTKKIIENFFHSEIFSEQKGLPRGVSLSSTFSDLYLEEFDKSLSKIPSIYYHSRYVDDLIIFSFEKIPDYFNFFQRMLPKPLELNKIKCKEFKVDDQTNKNHILDFLGYSFIISNKKHEKKRLVRIEVSENKINKIKKRISLSLKDYCRNGNHILLEKRIKYLTGNIPVNTHCNSKNILYSGIYYTFIHLTECEQLKTLDNFKNHLIHSPKGELAKKLSRHPINDYQKIKKYSFYFGHKNKIKYKFTSKELKEITRIW